MPSMLRTLSTLLVAGLLAAPVCSSANKKLIHPNEFPKGRPFSPGLLVDGTLYISGMTGNDLKSGQLPAEFQAEVRQTLDNIGLVLKAAGLSFADAVSVQVYLTDMALFPQMNEVYVKYFPEPRPTRTTVGIAKLVGTAKIEITVTARQ